MPHKRERPYIWATWLPRLITGESSYEWAIWFKAHYQHWDKPPSDFNQAEWLARHTTLLNEQRDQWLQRDYEVRVEDQNAFRLRGHSATLAGKPDLPPRVAETAPHESSARAAWYVLQRTAESHRLTQDAIAAT